MGRLLRWAWRTINRHWILQALFWVNVLFWGGLLLLIILSFLVRDTRNIANSGLFSRTPTAGSFISSSAEVVQQPPEATQVPPELAYKDVRVPAGIVEANVGDRVIFDETLHVFRGVTRDQPDLALEGKWPVTAADKVAVLEELSVGGERWMKIVIVSSAANPDYNGLGGWIVAWLIDGQGVPTPVPTPEATATVEATPEPDTAVPAPPVEQPTATVPSEFWSPGSPIIFAKEVHERTAEVKPGESKGCIEGYAQLHNGGPQIRVSFQMAGQPFVAVDVDPTSGYYRTCNMAPGTWAAVVYTINGVEFHDSDSSQAVPVTEGYVTTASWYEQQVEPTPQF